jgi:hypothetical protein
MPTNPVLDPGFEIPTPNPYWPMESDCAVNGAFIEVNTGIAPYEGNGKLRINSRATGPTCGRARQVITGLVVGRGYRCSLRWKSSGIFTGKTARVILGGVQVGSITGNSPIDGSWGLLACAVYVAVGTSADLSIDQLPGSGGVVFSRYFDAVFLEEITQPDAAILSVASRISAEVGSGSILAAPTAAGVRAAVASLGISAVPSSGSIVARVSKT